MAQALLQQRQLKEAEAILRRVVKDHPESPEAHFFLGTVLSNQEREEDAEKPLRKAVALDFPAQTRLAWCLASQGKLDEARSYCEESIRRGGTMAWAILGFVLRKENKLELAEEKLQEAVRRYAASSSPTVGPTAKNNRAYRFALRQLAKVVEERGRPEEAIDLYQRTLKLYREDKYAQRELERLQKRGIEPNR